MGSNADQVRIQLLFTFYSLEFMKELAKSYPQTVLSAGSGFPLRFYLAICGTQIPTFTVLAFFQSSS